MLQILTQGMLPLLSLLSVLLLLLLLAACFLHGALVLWGELGPPVCPHATDDRQRAFCIDMHASLHVGC